MADNLVTEQQKQRGRPFIKGQSGNPAGRPRRSRQRVTADSQLLLDGEAQALTRKALELALGGDVAALRLCIDRILPRCRERVVPVALPPMRDAGDLAGAMSAIIASAARGKISPDEGHKMCRLIEVFVRAAETSDFERRLKELEDRQGQRRDAWPSASGGW